VGPTTRTARPAFPTSFQWILKEPSPWTSRSVPFESPCLPPRTKAEDHGTEDSVEDDWESPTASLRRVGPGVAKVSLRRAGDLSVHLTFSRLSKASDCKPSEAAALTYGPSERSCMYLQKRSPSFVPATAMGTGFTSYAEAREPGEC